MSQQTCHAVFAPCTQYPICSRTCLSQTSITDVCNSRLDYSTRDCMCGDTVGYKITTQVLDLYFKRFFDCIEKECVGDERKRAFLEIYMDECSRAAPMNKLASYIPPEFALLISTTSTSKSTILPTANPTASIDPRNTSNPSSSTVPTSTPSNPSPDLSNGALAGISVGAAFVGILIAVVAAIIAWKQYKFMKMQREASSQNQNQIPAGQRFFWQSSAVEMEA